MFTMKEVCEQVGMPYETLKFYCKEGLVPNIKRDKNNYRIFDERNVAWLQGLQCLRKCGMSLKDMKQYMTYCLQGPDTIPERKLMLDHTKQALLLHLAQIEESITFIDNKQAFYNDYLDGTCPYHSNLIPLDSEE